MSPSPHLDRALASLDELSAELDALRNRLLRPGAAPAALPLVFLNLIRRTSNIRGNIDDGRTALQHELQFLRNHVKEHQAQGEQEKTRNEAAIAKLTHEYAELVAKGTAASDTVFDLRSSNTTRDGTIETLRTSLAAKEDEVVELQALLAGTKETLRRKHASASEMMANSHSTAIANLREEHEMHVNVLWDQIRQLRKGDPKFGTQSVVKDDVRPVFPSIPGRNRAAGSSKARIPTNAEIIPIDSDGVEQEDDGNADLLFRNDRATTLSKRPLSFEDELSIVKRARQHSPQEDRSSLTGNLGRPLSGNPLQDQVSCTDNTSNLWKFFTCAWDISTTETQILLRQFDAIFARGRPIEDVIQAIELHIVGAFTTPPVYPRRCLFAELRRRGRASGGQALARSCQHCRTDPQERICVWLSYVPGVRSTFGDRVEGVIPTDGRDYRRNIMPWTAQLGDTTARWVLHKRRTESSEAIVNPWTVNGIQITFDQDPLAD